MADLMSFRQYAERIGINPSSVSRAVERGQIPTVDIDGKRLIDPLAADEARERRARSHGPGGTPEKRAKAEARWRARLGCGYDHGQHFLLGALIEHGPILMQQGMGIAGSTDDAEIARACAVMREIVSGFCCSLHTEFNQRGINDYRKALPATRTPSFPPEATEIYRLLADGDSDPDLDWPFEPMFDRVLNISRPWATS